MCDCEDRVSQLEQDLKGIVKQHQQALSRLNDLEEQLSEERRRRERLEEQLEKRDDVHDLLAEVRKNGADDNETRAAVCLKALATDARRNDPPVASLDAGGVKNTLQNTIHRTNTYDVMEAAADLVDGDVVTVRRESRTSAKNTRLVVDLTAGELPAQVAGHDLTEASA